MKNNPKSQSSSASLDLYFQEIGRCPLLTKAEERELGLLNRSGDAAARERLITANLRLVIMMAKKYCGLGLSLEDLIAEGNRGLMTAVKRFDPTCGAALSTYASWWIRQSIVRAIENHGRTIRVPGHVLTRERKMRTAATELAQILGREPDDDELALHLGTDEAHVAQIRSSFQPMQALDEVNEDGDSLQEKLAVESTVENDPYSAACQECDSERVQSILAKLPERLREIIQARFGIGGDAPLTLSDLGRKMGVTRERVRQLEKRAMALLRQALYRLDPAANAVLLNVIAGPTGDRLSAEPQLCAAA